jgi:hypothetical protein
MKLSRTIFCLGVALLAAGCATMDKSECREADWRTIGLEDGAAGRTVSYIGNHRKACAEHGVSPDLAAYRRGHAIGVRQFCSPANGFSQGRAGRGYTGVCPADLEGGFLAAHATGRRLHDLGAEIDRLLREARQMDADREVLARRRDNTEAVLVSGALSATERKAVLDRYERLQTDVLQLDSDIRHFELEAARLQGEYDLLDASHGY